MSKHKIKSIKTEIMSKLEPTSITCTVSSTNPELSWLDFLLNRKLLIQHLLMPKPDPSPVALISQFLINGEKWPEPGSLDGSEPPSADTILKASRIRKNRALSLMAIQTAAYLDWDLDTLIMLNIGNQNSLMNHILNVSNESDSGTEFLKCLYHRWVLRTLQTNKVYRTNFRTMNPMILQPEFVQATDSIIKSLSSKTSIEYLKGVLAKHASNKSGKVLIPNLETFSSVDPCWSVGTEINASEFTSIIHLDLAIYLLYDGNKDEAIEHFKAQNIPTENFPYLKISKSKLEGYLRATGLKTSFHQEAEDQKIKLPTIEQSKICEMIKFMQDGDDSVEDVIPVMDITDREYESDRVLVLNEAKRIRQDSVTSVGQEQLEMFNCDRKLLETDDFLELKELVVRLNTISLGCSTVAKLFSEWELPVPVQHATEKIPAGALRDYVHILIAKSKQHLNLNNFVQARKALQIANVELEDSLRAGSSWVYAQYNIRKLVQMLKWEILLVDISDMIMNWGGTAHEAHAQLTERCKECIRFLEDPASEVSPRTEILENVLMALINLGEYKFVVNFEENQKRWPFVEFLGLLARVCKDLADKKDVSSSYRELWAAVLPVCMNSTGIKIQRALGKEGILSNRSSLMWVLDRVCSYPLITVFVSLLSRLHNHILDDVAVQIHTDLLHVWPNILDDVTTGSSLELKSRISGSSKLNIVQVQDFLFHLLNGALIRGEETLWLKCLGDIHLASGNPGLALKSYLEHLAICTDFFEKHSSVHWNDNPLFRKMIKCCEGLQCFTQAMILCQFLTEVDYTVAFGMAQEKMTLDSSDSLYGFIWDLTILEFLVNLHTKRNETKKRQEAVRLLGLLELNANNSEEIQREAMYLRKSQFMRTLAKMYVFV